RSLSARVAMGCGVARKRKRGSPHVAAIAAAVGRNGSVISATAGTPCSSISNASSTLLELHDPQSPTPETTKSQTRRRPATASSSRPWLGERLRTSRVTATPWSRPRSRARFWPTAPPLHLPLSPPPPPTPPPPPPPPPRPPP